MNHVLAAFAEYERRLIGERTKAALAAKRATGSRLGRPVSLPEGVRDRIGRETKKGRSLRALAADLEADSVPTAQGGTRWHASTVRAVVASIELDSQV
jgi:DNA invertase Pin-like site-specific DNA recombinase